MHLRAGSAILVFLVSALSYVAAAQPEVGNRISPPSQTNGLTDDPRFSLCSGTRIDFANVRSVARETVPGGLTRVSLNFRPLAVMVPTLKTRTGSASLATTDLAKVPLDSISNRYYVGGEVGVLYGRSSGKFGGSEFESYIIGTVGNEHVQISAGASYQESTSCFSRGGSRFGAAFAHT